MNTEIKTVNRFEEAGFDGERAKSMVVGIDDLLLKSMAAFREHFDHRFDAIDHRFEAIDHRLNALEGSMRFLQNFQTIGLLSIVAAMLFGFAGLIFALLSQS